MCDGKCQTMRFLGHFSKQEGQPNKVDTIIKAIRNLNAAGCDACPCKDVKLKETCVLEECKCLPPVIRSLSNAPIGCTVIGIFLAYNCLYLPNSVLNEIAIEGERLEQIAINT